MPLPSNSFLPRSAEPHLHLYKPKIIWIRIWQRLDLWQRYLVCLSLWRIQYVLKSQTYADASIPDVTGSVFMQRFSLFLAHCTLPLICLLTLYVNTSHLFLGSLCPSSIVHYLYPSSMPLPSFFLLLILGFSMSLFRLLLSPLILCVTTSLPFLPWFSVSLSFLLWFSVSLPHSPFSGLILCVPSFLLWFSMSLPHSPFSPDSLCPYTPYYF